MFAMTAIKGVGRRYANIVLKKADVDLDKRAGECSEEEVRHYCYYFFLSISCLIIIRFLFQFLIFPNSISVY